MKSQPSNTRSAVSNTAHVLDGLDGRSARARRFRDLLQSIADDLGGVDALSLADLSQARQAAALMIRAEQLQAAVVQDKGDAGELGRLSEHVRDILGDLRRSVQARTIMAA